MMKRTKRTIAMLLAALMFCLGFSACGNNDVPPEPPTESKAEDGPEDAGVLRVVTDLDLKYREAHGASNATKGKQALNSIIKYFGGMPSGIKVELDVLSCETDGSYDSELARIRTEIMSGKGPDVFLMSGFGGGWVDDPTPTQNTLFQNPEAAMKKGLFLPLDSYIENAQHMEFDQLDQKVMEAGRNEQGQIIMPMFYQLNEMLFSEEPEQMPADWSQVLASTEETVQLRGVQALHYWGFRELALDAVADNAAEELLISQDELYQRVKETLDFYRDNVGAWRAFTEDMTPERALALSQDLTYCVPGSAGGSVNAAIETWCAVNANTEQPEDAFAIVDMLMSKEFLSQKAFWKKREPTSNNEMYMDFFWTAGADRLPVYSNLIDKGGYKYTPLSTSRIKALGTAREDISYVYFTTNVERELDRVFNELRGRIENGEAVTDEEIRKAAGQCHMTMRMMLAES